MDVIGYTVYGQGLATQIAANCCEVSMHAGPHGSVDPRFPVLCAENHVKDDFAERLRHGHKNGLKMSQIESRFQRKYSFWNDSGALPQAVIECAPLALNTCPLETCASKMESCPRMKFPVHRFQSLLIHMRVNLCRRNIAMAEHLLNDA
jgi:hypothetical protein